VFASIPLAEVLIATLGLVMFRRGAWQKRVI